MSFRVKRVANLAVTHCYVCYKKMHMIYEKKTIFEVVYVEKSGHEHQRKWVCSNRCANFLILQGEYEIQNT